MAKQWVNSYGPRKVKPFVEAINAINQHVREHVEISGVVGGEERRCILWCPMGGGPVNTDGIARLEALGEKYGWVINDQNAAALLPELQALRKWCHENRPVVDTRKTAEEANKDVADMAARMAKQEKEHNIVLEAARVVMAKRPRWAEAAIVAELEQDESDAMTDYFGSRTLRRVVIGWRSGDRENFKQMRDAAKHFPETAHLATADEKAEHRETWAGGGGYYLSTTGRNSGWKVRAISLSSLERGIAVEDGLSALADEIKPTMPAEGIEISPVNEMGGIDIRFAERPSDEVLEFLRNNGWRWSRRNTCWYKRADEAGVTLGEATRIKEMASVKEGAAVA